eukprot:7798171-Pyramimonas_sp.AAC.1
MSGQHEHKLRVARTIGTGHLGLDLGPRAPLSRVLHSEILLEKASRGAPATHARLDAAQAL